jgi:polyisoprenyl-phosphate glycosyltransferase
MSAADGPDSPSHRISVVIPVYQGESTLSALLVELDELTSEFVSPDGHPAVVAEILLVFDNGPDGSAEVIRSLARTYPTVRPVWLSRNFGQHPATLAGMASSGGDWIVTMDEDGQHDPGDIGRMLDTAIRERASVVYAKPENAAPHGALRNAASKGAKRTIRALAGGLDTTVYQSYRLILGEVGRSVAAYAGAGVYLDVALGWVAGDVATCPVRLRAEGDRSSGYSLRTLLSHFWRMVLSSGTRGLRVVSITGIVLGVLGLLFAIVIVVGRLTGDSTPAGWASMVIIVLLTSGAVLFSLGIVAEYVGVAVNMAMGKPLYLIVSDREAGPLGRRRAPR